MTDKTSKELILN